MALLILGNCNKYRLISCSATFFALDLGSKIGVIEFHDALEVILPIPHFHGSPDPAEHIPGGFAANLKLTGQSKGRDTALVADSQIDCPEPLGQGQMGAVHDGIGSQSSLVTAMLALIAAIALHGIMLPATTLGADIPLGPLYLIQIVGTGFLRGEPLDESAET